MTSPPLRFGRTRCWKTAGRRPLEVTSTPGFAGRLRKELEGGVGTGKVGRAMGKNTLRLLETHDAAKPRRRLPQTGTQRRAEDKQSTRCSVDVKGEPRPGQTIGR